MHWTMAHLKRFAANILKSWAEDDALLIAMANAALQDKRGATLEECRIDILKKIFWIKERYDSIERDYLDEIDGQVRRYTRATTQKIENLTNRDHNVRGNINYILQELSRNRRAGSLVEQIQPAFQLFEQSFLSPKSLWYRKRPDKRIKAAPVPIEDSPIDDNAFMQAQKLLNSEYGRVAVATYVEQWLGDSGIVFSKDMQLRDDKSYIMSLLAVLASSDRNAQYIVKELGGTYSENEYVIPQLQIRRKEGKK